MMAGTAGAQWAVELAEAAARACGLDPSGARCLRERASVLVELPAAGALARVESPARRFLAERMARIARAIGPRGAPIAPLLAPSRQPVISEAGAVTLWAHVEGRHAGLDEYELIGRLLRRWHDLTRPLVAAEALPRFNPFEEVEVWLEGLVDDGYPPARLAGLEVLADRHAATWAAIADDRGLDLVVVHGDVHHENVLIGPAGPCFVDLEMSGVAPAAWDFATLAAGVHRYGLAPAVFDALVRGYGGDPRSGPHSSELRDLYEFICAVWAASCRHGSAALAAEAELRVAALLAEPGPDSDPDSPGPRWTLL